MNILKAMLILAVGALVYQLFGGNLRIGGAHWPPFLSVVIIVVMCQTVFLLWDN